MKALCTLMILLGLSGCVEFACYSNVEHAEALAEKFCSQGNGDKKLCDSLTIDGSNVCGIAKFGVDKCRPNNVGFRTFNRVRDPECRKLDEKTCKTLEYCKWTFNDSLDVNYFDSIEPRS